MKALFLILIAIIVLTSRGTKNANIDASLSAGIDRSSEITGERLYSGYRFSIWRIKVEGVSFLINSAGGIVKE